MATSWRGAQPLAGQSVAPFGDMCDSPPLSLLHPLHSRVGRQAGRQTTTRNATSNKLIIIIFAQPLPLSSSRQGAAPQTERQTDGRIDKQTERHLSLAANNKDDSGSSHVLAAVGLSSRRNTLPQRRRLAKVPGSTWPAPLGRL